jgi:hypothetical protein
MNVVSSQQRAVGSANPTNNPTQFENQEEPFGQAVIRQNKTASGSRTQKTTTSYSLTGARNGPGI